MSESINPDDFSLESRQTLLELSARIQEMWWADYTFKFQRGWIAAALFKDEVEIHDAIRFGRQILNSIDDTESEKLFDQCWMTYLCFLASIKEKDDEDE